MDTKRALEIVVNQSRDLSKAKMVPADLQAKFKAISESLKPEMIIGINDGNVLNAPLLSAFAADGNRIAGVNRAIAGRLFQLSRGLGNVWNVLNAEGAALLVQLVAVVDELADYLVGED